jgi:HEXXH motif-containing protein
MYAGQVITTSDHEGWRWALPPDSACVATTDKVLRARLSSSLDYLAELVRTGEPLPEMSQLRARLDEGPVSPWLFCLYSKLVADLSKREDGQVRESFEALSKAAFSPAEEGVVAYRDPSISPVWWDHFHRLLDTDRQRPLNFEPPEPEVYARCEADIQSALALLQWADSQFFEEVRSLARLIVLATPGPNAGFNGASTFFLWAGILINARVRRNPIQMIDLLVHESSHVLLFGIAAEEPLTRNSATDRYASPVRPDPRPIDGIFHACFVTTRVHLAMSRLLETGLLSSQDAVEARGRRDFNGNAARASFDLLRLHAETTDTGKQVLDALHDYLASV